MKRHLFTLCVVLICGAFGGGSVRADESGVSDFGLQEQKGYRDECLLVAINCGSDVISLEQKIEKLKKEIAKGRAVYTDDELRILKEQLHNAIKTEKYFNDEGAQNWYRYPDE